MSEHLGPNTQEDRPYIRPTPEALPTDYKVGPLSESQLEMLRFAVKNGGDCATGKGGTGRSLEVRGYGVVKSVLLENGIYQTPPRGR